MRFYGVSCLKQKLFGIIPFEVYKIISFRLYQFPCAFVLQIQNMRQMLFQIFFKQTEVEETEISTTEETTTTETITTTTTTLKVAPEEEEDTAVRVVDETHTTRLDIAPNFVKPLFPKTMADEGDIVR